MSGDEEEQPRAVLLDTCAVIWLMNGSLPLPVFAALVHAGLADGVFVSPVSAWEVGLLSKPKAARGPGVRFLPDPKTWFAKVMAAPGIREAALTPDIAIDAYTLPGHLHGDPGDRLIIATARHLNIPIVTRDAKIIAYADAGHMRVIPC